LEIIFIGTSSGKTSLKRFHSSFLINSKNFNLLVDAGDGVSKALKNQNITPNAFDGIIISHLHPDHYSGLASLLVQMKLTGRSKALNIFTHKSVSAYVKEFISHSYIFEERLGFNLSFVEFNFDKWINICSNLKILARQNTHLDKYRSLNSIEKLNLISCSFFFRLNKQNILYTGDVGKTNDLYLFEDYKINTIIAESTHIDKSGLLSVIRKLRPAKIYLTHISDEGEDSILSWKSSLPDEIRSKIEIASDGLSFPL